MSRKAHRSLATSFPTLVYRVNSQEAHVNCSIHPSTM